MDELETYRGFRLVAEIDYDECAEAPWLMCDCLGKVSDWERRDKAPGEMILSTDKGFKRFYGFQAAVANGKLEGMTGEQAAKSALAEFDRLRQWCNDYWSYVVVTVKAINTVTGETAETFSCGCVESDATDEVIAELQAEAKGWIDEQADRTTEIFYCLEAVA